MPVVILAAVVVPLALSVAVALVFLAVGLLAASLAGVGGRVQVFGRKKQQRGPRDGLTALPHPAHDLGPPSPLLGEPEGPGSYPGAIWDPLSAFRGGILTS